MYAYFFCDFKKQKRGLYKSRETKCTIFVTNRNFTDQWDNWTFTTSALLHFRIKKTVSPRIMRSKDFTRIESNILKTYIYIYINSNGLGLSSTVVREHRPDLKMR